MTKKKIISLLILTITTVIGVILSFPVGSFTGSINILVSWILVGLWLIIIIKIFNKFKYYREFNSEHNNIFLIIGIMFLGLFYSFWGNYTYILNFNILNLIENIPDPISNNYIPYVSLWEIIFAFPLEFYGSILLYKSYKKYYVVYIKEKSYNARKFGILSSILIICFQIIYLLNYYEILDIFESNIEPVQTNFNYLIISTGVLSTLLLLRYGIFNRGTDMKNIANVIPAHRMSSRIRVNNNQSSTSYTQNRPNPRNYASRTQKSQRRKIAHSTKSRKNMKQKPTSAKSKPVKKNRSAEFQKYKPKGTRLTSEDFKCIFCFQLPKPSDGNIVLCPSCKHPAHFHEFKEWLRSSSLCSRCDATIPSNYRRNPLTISSKRYLDVMKYYLRK